MFVTSCGYRSPASTVPRDALCVDAAPLATPHIEALDAALAGARAELARHHALRSRGYPRLVVELVRVDELPSGILASEAAGGRLPLARGSEVGVVGRAYVVDTPGGPKLRDTGDVRRVETVAQGGDLVRGGVAYSEAVRAASRRLGAALVRRSLGQAEPALESM